MDLQNYTLLEFGKVGEPKRRERFIRKHWNGVDLFLITTDGKMKMPHAYRKLKLDEDFDLGRVRIVEDDDIVACLREETNLGENERLRLNSDWLVIGALDSEPDIMESEARGKLIRDAIKTDHSVYFSSVSFTHFPRLIRRLSTPNPRDSFYEMSALLWEQVSTEAKCVILDRDRSEFDRRNRLAEEFNRILAGPNFYQKEKFAGVHLDPVTTELLSKHPQADDLPKLNRHLFEALFPLDIAKFENALSRGTVNRLLIVLWRRCEEHSSRLLATRVHGHAGHMAQLIAERRHPLWLIQNKEAHRTRIRRPSRQSSNDSLSPRGCPWRHSGSVISR